jgi:hypothetical protein
MFLKRLLELKMQRVVNGMADATTRTGFKSYQLKKTK